MQIINCEASVWYIQSDKLSIWSIGLPPPLFMINSSILKRMLRFFFISRYEFIRWLFCTEKGIIMHALTIRHFYIMCHHLFYARRKLLYVFGPILLMNECCFYEWCLCEIDCVFFIFFFFFMWGWSKA